jgi:2-keto-4-pentenoate hydratase
VDVESAAELLDGAHLRGVLLEAVDVRVGGLAAAYGVQDALTARRLARGATRIGWKLGYTSAVMRTQMGIGEPNLGPLLSSMVVTDVLDDRFVQPRVEPEIALVLGEDPGPGAGVQEVLGACRSARIALEVVDSVWAGYVFDLEHNTADGSSAAGVVLGDEIPLDRLDEVAVALHVDGIEVGSGRGADASGHPALGIAWLSARLAERGLALADGDVVITGGLTAAHPLSPGSTVSAVFSHDGFGSRTVEVRR